MSKTVNRYQEMRPDKLAMCVRETPVAYWPLGLIEHHGWHLPVGFDGLKAEHICCRLAQKTGGVLLPTMWWGAGGGHGEFLWTHYQSDEAAQSILTRTVGQLIRFGFHAIILLAGHYPWQSILDRSLPEVTAAHPEVLLLWGTEMSIGGPELGLRGDHAAREETSYGLHLFPDQVDLDALTSGRDDSVWPNGEPPPVGDRHPGVSFAPADPLFAQMGEDARLASATRGQQSVDRLVAHLAQRIEGHLSELPEGASRAVTR